MLLHPVREYYSARTKRKLLSLSMLPHKTEGKQQKKEKIFLLLYFILKTLQTRVLQGFYARLRRPLSNGQELEFAGKKGKIDSVRESNLRSNFTRVSETFVRSFRISTIYTLRSALLISSP